MTPWEVVQATAGRGLGRVYLHMIMGDTPHLPEGGFTGDGMYADYRPTKGVRASADLARLRNTPYTPWRELEAALRTRVDPEPIREAWEAHRAAFRTFQDLAGPYNDACVRGGGPDDDLKARYDDAHRLAYRTEQAALDLLRAAIADPAPGDLLDMLGGAP